MSLGVGARLGHYAVTAKLGEGGMGEVWRATDTQLNRDVALKILPEAFATDPDRLARFQREAQVLASLNHPNIAQIHGIEEEEGTRALVLELVEGPTLADRISKGPIPLDEALPIAKQIAEALEAAHEALVIHRDLKPANIKVREDGTVKVLDFGLAKALDPSPTSDPSESPTLTAAATQMGVIMGTAAYMSPEQAAGEGTDQRSDIWSFGVVVLEMITGHRLFEGKTVSHVLASVLKTDPDWSTLPTTTPRALRRLLRRCLEKDPKRRLRDVTEAVIHLEEAETGPVTDQSTTEGTGLRLRGWREVLPWVAGLMLAVISGLTVWSLMRTEPPRVVRFMMTPDGADRFHIGTSSPDVAISPSGDHIAYLTGGIPGLRAELLHVQSLDRLTSDILVAEGDLNSPFFSPDGASVGFYDRRGGTDPVLQRVAVRGGPVSTICELPGFLRGASWGADDTIIFATSDPSSGLWQVAAVGGEPEQLTTPDAEQGEVDHRWPEFLPGGAAVLFTIAADSIDDSAIAVLSLDTGEHGRSSCRAVRPCSSRSRRTLSTIRRLPCCRWTPVSKRSSFAVAPRRVTRHQAICCTRCKEIYGPSGSTRADWRPLATPYRYRRVSCPNRRALRTSPCPTTGRSSTSLVRPDRRTRVQWRGSTGAARKNPWRYLSATTSRSASRQMDRVRPSVSTMVPATLTSGCRSCREGH